MIARMNQGADLPMACLGDAADVVRGRGEIAQHDGGCPPEGNERQHDGGGDDDLGRIRPFRDCSRENLLSILWPDGFQIRLRG